MKTSPGKIPLYLAVLSSLLLAAVGVYALTRVAPAFLEKVERGAVRSQSVPGSSPAPDFVLDDVKGGAVRLSDFRGRIVLLYFWTSWNPIARDGLGALDTYAQSAPRDVVVLAVNSLEGKTTVEGIQKRLSGNLKVLLDGEGVAGELYGVGTLPLTVALDEGGFERERAVGPLSAQQIAQEVERLR